MMLWRAQASQAPAALYQSVPRGITPRLAPSLDFSIAPWLTGEMRRVSSGVSRRGMAAGLGAMLAGCVPQLTLRQSVRRGVLAEVGTGLSNTGAFTIREGGVIVFLGDELIAGPAAPRKAVPGALSPRAIPEVVARALDHRVKTRVFARAGETLKQGLSQASGQSLYDMLVVSYAYGDAKAGTPQAEYRDTLTDLAKRASATGTPLILIVPPIMTDAVLNGKLEPYRQVMREMAALDAAVVESAPLLGAAQQKLPQALPLTSAGYTAIASGIVSSVLLAPSGGPPRPDPRRRADLGPSEPSLPLAGL